LSAAFAGLETNSRATWHQAGPNERLVCPIGLSGISGKQPAENMERTWENKDIHKEKAENMDREHGHPQGEGRT